MAVTENANTYKRVLIVDDQAINRKVMEIILMRFGVEKIVMASEGIEALSKLKKFPECDLVITDIKMPRLTGFGLLRKLREDPIWAELPVYAVTADRSLEAEVSQSGFDGFVFKPLTNENLGTLLKTSAA